MRQFKHGWKPDKLDPRDKLYRKIAKPRSEPLPDAVDLRSGCSPVEDQGELGSCTANALAGALEFLELKAGLPLTNLSRLFIYYNEREMEDDVDEDNGAQIRDGIKTLNQIGVCPEPGWRYEIGKFASKPPEQCYHEAERHKITSYHRLITLDDMLGCLSDGYPFVFGFSVFSGFQSPEVHKTGVLDLPRHNEMEIGGHAVMAVGYNQSTQRFLVRNSWGSDWGMDGYFTIPYEYLETMADDFWAIIR